jgi:hypothetical protein
MRFQFLANGKSGKRISMTLPVSKSRGFAWRARRHAPLGSFRIFEARPGIFGHFRTSLPTRYSLVKEPALLIPHRLHERDD